MSIQLPPAPVGTPFGSYTWADWYFKIRDAFNKVKTNHNDLDNIQGGTTNERYHLTLSEYNKARNAMSLRRILRDTITIPGGSTSATYTIATPVLDLNKVDFSTLGTMQPGGSGTVSDSLVRIELTNTTTITAYRGNSLGGVVTGFQLIEYN